MRKLLKGNSVSSPEQGNMGIVMGLTGIMYSAARTGWLVILLLLAIAAVT